MLSIQKLVLPLEAMELKEIFCCGTYTLDKLETVTNELTKFAKTSPKEFKIGQYMEDGMPILKVTRIK